MLGKMCCHGSSGGCEVLLKAPSAAGQKLGIPHTNQALGQPGDGPGDALHPAIMSPARCLRGCSPCVPPFLALQLLGLQTGRKGHVGCCSVQHGLCCSSFFSQKAEEPEAVLAPCKTSSLPVWPERSPAAASVESYG